MHILAWGLAAALALIAARALLARRAPTRDDLEPAAQVARAARAIGNDLLGGMGGLPELPEPEPPTTEEVDGDHVLRLTEAEVSARSR